MSHETHGHEQTEKKSVISMRSSFWFVVILVFLFIAALNFINVMGHYEEGEGHEPHATEHSEAHGTEAGAASHEEHAAPATEIEHTEGHTEETHEEAHH